MKQYSSVFIPYCTGDLHLGFNTYNYTDRQVSHVGALNSILVLDWVKNAFPSPQRVYVLGGSADPKGRRLP